MIRDPSDGSVRQSEQICTETKVPAHPISGPILDPTTSGLPTGSGKPDNIARLEKSREWLNQYFHRKTEGT